MKTKKVLILTAFLLLVLSAAIIIVNSTFAIDENPAASSITLTNDGLKWLYGSDILGGGTIQFHKKIVTTTNGISKAAYCTEATVTMAATTCNYLKETSAGQAYIMANGANSNVSDEDYFVTQMSLWWWIRCYDSSSQTVSTTCPTGTDGFTALSAFTLDFNNPDNSVYTGSENGNVTGGVPAKMATLLNEALETEKAGTPGAASISIDKSNTKLTKDGDYYKSTEIGITATNISGNYTVSIASGAPTGATITNTSGDAQTNFATNEKFIVKVPAENLTSATKITINVTANGNSATKGYEYDCSDNYQNLAIAETISSNAEDNAIFSANLNSVKISKIDITSGEELPGAKLTVHEGKCNSIGENTEIESWISTTEPHYIELDAGDYCLVETQAPAGYVLSTEKIDFTVTDGSDTPTVLMENSQTEVVISKQDATTGKELPGAKLVLKDSNGIVKDEWTSTEEKHTIYGLAPGEYTLTETIAPEGYELSTETATFTIKENGTVDEVVMKNNPVKTSEQVPTGDLPIIIALILATISLGITIYYYYMNKNTVK